ncbi:MAG: SpoIIE family protein phosphatase [Paludibacteraceae bacterium]|nr:SpoIIE family protein phosphatase [Paludibacteraceae bacterium]
MNQKKNHSGLWIMIVAAVALEAISCIMYFTSRSAIRHEADLRAKTELRKAELEIELHTIEMETAAKALALLAEKHVDCPDSIYAATELAVRTLREHTSMAVAYIPDYFPKQGHFFEICSSRITADSVHTRQIGSDDHDYTQMEWFQNGFSHDSCWWCEPYMDNSGSEAPVVSCSYPVRNAKGEVVAVVCVDMPLDYLQKKLPEYLQVYQNSFYSIRSSKGGDIVRVVDTVPGGKYSIYNEEIDATGWHIEIIIPEEELFRELNHTGRIVGILMLLGMGLLAMMLIHSSRTNKKLLDSTAKNQRMENELYVASAIQTAMLPKVFPPFNDLRTVNIYGMVKPAKEVGGDLYDFYVRHDKLFFCIGDVSGKGVPASLVMAMTRSLFRSITSHDEDAASVMTKMNKAFVEQNTQNMFLTLFIGILDSKTGTLDYCNAGHNAPVRIQNTDRSADRAQMMNVLPNLPLGVESEWVFTAQQIQMAYNDMLFLYTDGLTEAERRTHEQYGEERMMKQLTDEGSNGLTGPRKLVEAMQANVETFVDGADQSDDLTMMAIRYQMPALIMRNDIEQIPTLSEWIDSLSIPEELNMPINLALEEIVTNVMLYAYPGKHGQVLVEYTAPLIFTITDSGIAFDPTKKEEVDTTLSAEERPIGGLGIHLVRQIMDEVIYERVDDKNVLTLIKHI